MKKDNMQERPGAQLPPEWKDELIDALLPAMRFATVLMAGMAIGIALCKFWPEFWRFVNWGISV